MNWLFQYEKAKEENKFEIMKKIIKNVSNEINFQIVLKDLDFHANFNMFLIL